MAYVMCRHSRIEPPTSCIELKSMIELPLQTCCKHLMMRAKTGVNMAVNIFCRLCDVNLRIHGTITASKLIFARVKQENICSQLLNLGLDLLNTALCSSSLVIPDSATSLCFTLRQT